MTGGKQQTFRLGEGKRKNRALNDHVSWFDQVGLTSHDSQQKEVELCVPPRLLCVIELLGGRTDSDDIEGAQAGPQRFPERPSILHQNL